MCPLELERSAFSIMYSGEIVALGSLCKCSNFSVNNLIFDYHAVSLNRCVICTGRSPKLDFE